MEKSKDQLSNWPVSTDISVQWGDLDALNHVNHTVFLTWMETARMVYFERCGMMEMLESEGIGPILGGIKADYSSPVNFPDSITVQTTMSRLGRSSFDMDYRIISERKGKIVCTGTAFGVMYDYGKGQSTPIRDDLKMKIIELENS